MMEYIKGLFDDPVSTAFDSGDYCDFSSTAANAVAGKDVLIAIWNKLGTKILAIAGQQSLSLSRTAETNEVITKDSEGSWSAAVAGMKSWSIDTGGVFVADDESHQILGQAFENGDNVCVKIYNRKAQKGMYGGIATITDYSIDAPYDDSMTYSCTLQGVGKLTDFSIDTVEHDTMPA
jgi:TP901-1 family phage major tail protein